MDASNDGFLQQPRQSLDVIGHICNATSGSGYSVMPIVGTEYFIVAFDPSLDCSLETASTSIAGLCEPFNLQVIVYNVCPEKPHKP